VLAEEAGYSVVASYSVLELDHIMTIILKHQIIYSQEFLQILKIALDIAGHIRLSRLSHERMEHERLTLRTRTRDFD
jgi:hypothetical protein